MVNICFDFKRAKGLGSIGRLLPLFLIIVVFWSHIVSIPVLAQTQVSGTVKPGSVDNQVTVTLTNRSSKVSVENLTVTVLNEPELIQNVRIKTDSPDSLPPGKSRAYIVKFDVPEDALPGESETVTFKVSSDQDVNIEHPNPTLTIEIEESSEAPPVLKLVKIFAPEPKRHGAERKINRYNIESNEGEPGYVMRYIDYGNPQAKQEWIASMRVTEAPTEIILGQPFSISAEASKRNILKPGSYGCGVVISDVTLAVTMKPQLGGYAPVRQVEVQSTQDINRPCQKRKEASGYKDAAVKIHVKFIPVKQEAEHFCVGLGLRKYFYRFQVITDGKLERLSDSPVRVCFKYPTNERGYLSQDADAWGIIADHKKKSLSRVTRGRGGVVVLNVKISDGPKVTFVYNPIYEGDTYIASIPPYEFPPELSRPPHDGTEDIQVAEEEGRGTGEREEADSIEGEEIAGIPGTGTGEGEEAVTPTESGPGSGIVSEEEAGEQITEDRVDPDTIDPNSQDVANFIREWTSNAKPPINVLHGANLRYNEWGQEVGQAVGGVITAEKPSNITAATAEGHVWNLRDKLDSVNHCTLKEYVVAKVEGRSIEHCRGRYQAIGNLEGKSLDKAKTILNNAGLAWEVIKGSPAPDKQREGTVESHQPGPGKGLKRGGTVALKVFQPVVFVAIPDVDGLSLSKAKDRLKRAGLKAEAEEGDPAPSEDKERTIASQKPGAGTKLKPGETVHLTYYGKYRPLLVPKVVNKKFDDAMKILAEVRLKGVPTIKGPAESEDQEMMVIYQKPAFGKAAKPGQEVKLRIYGKYRPLLVPEVTNKKFDDAMKILAGVRLKGVPTIKGPAESEDQEMMVIYQTPAFGEKAKPGQEVKLIIYGKYKRLLVPEEQVRVADCSHRPGSIAVFNRQTRSYECRCPEGQKWSEARTQCVSNETFANDWCAANVPGTVAVWIDSQRGYECHCSGGQVWNARQRKCVRRVGERDRRRCDLLYFQIRQFRRNTDDLSRQMVTKIAQEARNRGCDPKKIAEALGDSGTGTMGGGRTGTGSGDEEVCNCPPGYTSVFGSDCVKNGDPNVVIPCQ